MVKESGRHAQVVRHSKAEARLIREGKDGFQRVLIFLWFCGQVEAIGNPLHCRELRFRA